MEIALAIPILCPQILTILTTLWHYLSETYCCLRYSTSDNVSFFNKILIELSVHLSLR